MLTATPADWALSLSAADFIGRDELFAMAPGASQRWLAPGVWFPLSECGNQMRTRPSVAQPDNHCARRKLGLCAQLSQQCHQADFTRHLVALTCIGRIGSHRATPFDLAIKYISSIEGQIDAVETRKPSQHIAGSVQSRTRFVHAAPHRCPASGLKKFAQLLNFRIQPPHAAQHHQHVAATVFHGGPAVLRPSIASPGNALNVPGRLHSPVAAARDHAGEQRRRAGSPGPPAAPGRCPMPRPRRRSLPTGPA